MLNRPDVQVMPTVPPLPVLQPGAEAEQASQEAETISAAVVAATAAAVADMGWEDLGDGDSDSSPSIMIED